MNNLGSVLTSVSPWLYMWLLTFLVFGTIKAITYFKSDHQNASLLRKLNYFFIWPGLDAPAFLREPCIIAPTFTEYFFAIIKTCLGLFLFFIAPKFISPIYSKTIAWVAMVGIIFTLHFGAFHILSCIYRSLGIMARPIMNCPIAAQSISEFWGKRWNTAFRDFVHRFIFRPIAARWGIHKATMLVFIISGLIHDFVISLPAGGGYGKPTLFFLNQGLWAL